MVDLGRWFHEEYVVPGESAFDVDDLEELEAYARRASEDEQEGSEDERDA